MSVTEGPLRLATRLINRSISQSETARAELSALAGAGLRIHVEGLGLTLFLLADQEALTFCQETDRETQATVAGLPLGLLSMVGDRPPDAAALRRQGVRLDGDEEIAAAFASLLRRARPDLEEELSMVVGDVAAHQVGNALRALGLFGSRTLNTLRLNTGEFLQEESRVMPTRLEVRAFCDDVDEIRDGVERAAARLSRLERRSAGD